MSTILEKREVGPEDRFPQDLIDPIKALWQDAGVKAAFSKGCEYALHDNVT